MGVPLTRALDPDDPRRLPRRLLAIALLTLAFYTVGSIMVTGASVRDGAGAPDPTREACEARAAELPATIPAILVLGVTDEDGATLDAKDREAMRAALEAAIARFGLAGSVALDLGDEALAWPVGAHVVDVEAWTRRALAPERADGSSASEGAEGMMCGNAILARFHDDAAFDAWTIAHELGHYLGLPHHDRTLMNNDANRAPRYDVLAECQRAILAAWQPGAPYVPHWQRGEAGECAAQDAPWRVHLDTARYELTGT